MREDDEGEACGEDRGGNEPQARREHRRDGEPQARRQHQGGGEPEACGEDRGGNEPGARREHRGDGEPHAHRQHQDDGEPHARGEDWDHLSEGGDRAPEDRDDRHPQDATDDRAPGDDRDDRARRHVDKSLAEDFVLDDEREDEPEPAPPPWTGSEAAPTAPPPSPPPPRTHPCWSCPASVPSGAPVCPECQESARHLRLISTRPPVDLRHGAGGPLHLGRHPAWAAPAVAAALDDAPGVSRRHASIELNPDGTVWLTEHPSGTTNGTFVNDERIPHGVRVPLGDGDTVGLGRHCAFRVLLVEPPA